MCLAQELGGFKTKKEAVTAVLEEFVRKKRIEGLIEMMGTVDFDPEYDYKEERRRGNRRIPEWDE